MEFVEPVQLREALRGKGVVERASVDGALVTLGIEPARRGATVAIGESSAALPADALAVRVPDGRMADVLEAAVRKLHLLPLYLVPAARWKEVFATVAFGLADNPQWTELDSTATVEANTRDPLLCDPAHLHVLRDLVRVLLAEGEPGPRAALHLVAPVKLLVARIEPGRPIEIECGDAGMGQALAEAARHAAGT